MSSSESTSPTTAEPPLPPPSTPPAQQLQPTAPPNRITHTHNIVSATSIAKKVSQCLAQLFPSPPPSAPTQPPSLRRAKGNIGGATVSSSTSTTSTAPPKPPQIIITLTAKSVSASKAITICEILKRRIAERGLCWYQYCTMTEVLEEVKPKKSPEKEDPAVAAAKREEIRRRSWAGKEIPSTPRTPTRQASISRLSAPPPSDVPSTPTRKATRQASLSRLGPTAGAAAGKGTPMRRSVSVSVAPGAATSSTSTTSDLARRSSAANLGSSGSPSPARSLSRSFAKVQQKKKIELTETFEDGQVPDEDDPFGPLSSPPRRPSAAQPEKEEKEAATPVKRAMPLLTIYLSMERIEEHKDVHGEQTNEATVTLMKKAQKGSHLR